MGRCLRLVCMVTFGTILGAPRGGDCYVTPPRSGAPHATAQWGWAWRTAGSKTHMQPINSTTHTHDFHCAHFTSIAYAQVLEPLALGPPGWCRCGAHAGQNGRCGNHRCKMIRIDGSNTPNCCGTSEPFVHGCSQHRPVGPERGERGCAARPRSGHITCGFPCKG